MEKTITKKNKKYIKWLDIAKGIAIVLTIIGHTVKINSTTRNLIYSFHMPLFLILSGYTIKKLDLKDLLKATIKDIKRLLVPAFICAIIKFFLNIYIDDITPFISLKMLIKSLIWGNCNPYELTILGHTYTMCRFGFIWFLVALFWAKLLYRLILYKVKDNRMIFCLFIGFAGIMIGQKIQLPQCIDIVMVSMIFMEFGQFLHNLNEEKISSTKENIITFICFSLWIYLCFNKRLFLEFSVRFYPLSMISIIIAIAASWCFIKFSKSIEDFKLSSILVFLGKNSLDLLCIHFFDEYIINLWNFSNSIIISCLIRCLIDIIILYIYVFIKNHIKKNKRG